MVTLAGCYIHDGPDAGPFGEDVLVLHTLGGYRRGFTDWVAERVGWDLEVVLRPDDCPSRFHVLSNRWIVEHSFIWQENFRRLSLDYEYLTETSKAIVQLAFDDYA